MKRTNKGIIALSFGIYLAIVNTILSLLINKVYYLHGFPSNPYAYLIDWLMYYGAITFIPAAIGIYLIIISFHYLQNKSISLKK